MYLKALNRDDHVRLYEQRCRDPQEQRGCLPLSNRVRREITAGFDGTTLDIVHRQWAGAPGIFWVLGPIRFSERLARYRFAWEGDGCTSHGSARFRRQPGGVWKFVGGPGGTSCA